MGFDELMRRYDRIIESYQPIIGKYDKMIESTYRSGWDTFIW